MARSASTAPTSARSTWPSGASVSPRCSRTTSGTSCRWPTTSRRSAATAPASPARSKTPPPTSLADLDTVLSRAYAGGTDLSGGQWQRVALARALHAVHGRRRRGVARRTHRAARRARRSRDLRPHPASHQGLHHDPDLAPLRHGAPRRSHLRARTRQGDRARHPRRTDRARAAATAPCSTCRRRASRKTASPATPKTSSRRDRRDGGARPDDARHPAGEARRTTCRRCRRRCCTP